MSDTKQAIHLSLEGTLSSLYAPEIRLDGVASEENACIRVVGSVRGGHVAITQMKGCKPAEGKNTVHVEGTTFSLVIAWHDANPAPRLGMRGLFAGLFPFECSVFELGFEGVHRDLTCSIRIQIPHYLTRYYRGTRNLQHTFSEGLRAPSQMSGVATDGSPFQMHLHYKSLDAFRRIATPAVTVIGVAYLNLAAIQTAKTADWRSEATVMLGVLGINLAALSTLAAIRVGSTLRSLLNVVRAAAVTWVLALTASIREGGVFGLDLTALLGAGLKACIIWLFVMAAFAFGVYPLADDPRRRRHAMVVLVLVGLAAWVLFLFAAPLTVAAGLADKLR